MSGRKNRTRDVSRQTALRIFDKVENALSVIEQRLLTNDALCEFRYFTPQELKADAALEDIKERRLNPHESRAVATMLGLVAGDALGSPLEFSPVTYDDRVISGFEDTHVWERKPNPGERGNAFRLKPGQWTDDTSMALCMADSLLAKGAFDPVDMRLRFLLWWEMGYNNAFGNDADRRAFMGACTSVGLGGNISMSISEFAERPGPYTKEGDHATSGNGSLMRLAPVPIWFAGSREEAEKVAALSSKTTHQGTEAAECCRLLTHLVTKAVRTPGSYASAEQLLSEASLAEFETSLYSVKCLRDSRAEEDTEGRPGFVQADRDWNWRRPDFKYAPSRAAKQPGYVGSYAMDALAMALHCVWSTNSFADAVLKAANLRGDSDTVAAIAGQLAGAIYGVEAVPLQWIQTIAKWDDGTIAARALELFRRSPHNTQMHNHTPSPLHACAQARASSAGGDDVAFPPASKASPGKQTHSQRADAHEEGAAAASSSASGGAGGQLAVPVRSGGQQMFAVEVKRDCPHTHTHVAGTTPAHVDIAAPCNGCGDVGENWLCLQCHKVHCSRYRNGCNQKHMKESGHVITKSFADLSTWCNLCESYIKARALRLVDAVCYSAKFPGEVEPLSDDEQQAQAQAEGAAAGGGAAGDESPSLSESSGGRSPPKKLVKRDTQPMEDE